MKPLFWDTSAIVGLIFKERASAAAIEAWDSSDVHFAWRWLVVEASACLARRHASGEQWGKLDKIVDDLLFVDIDPLEMTALCRSNRQWTLRAADAGHLFVCSKVAVLFPDLRMVCFDNELCEKARKTGIVILGDRSSPFLKEKRLSYGRKIGKEPQKRAKPKHQKTVP